MLLRTEAAESTDGYANVDGELVVLERSHASMLLVVPRK